MLLIVNVVYSFARVNLNEEPISDLRLADEYRNFIYDIIPEANVPFMLASPLIINSQDTVLFDFSNAFCTPSYMQVPVKFNSDDSIYALDFALKFDPGVFTYISIVNHKPYISYSANYNSTDSTLRFTSFSFQPMDNNTDLISIRFSLPVSQIDYAQFDSVYTLLNGDICSSKAIESIPPPVIAVGGPTTIVPGDSLSLSITPVAGLSYLWSNGETDSIIYVNSPGLYFVNTFFPNGCNAITYIQIFPPAPLPIELINFESKSNESEIKISWTTASELNNDYFILERSVDGHSWRDIALIDGAGNSTSYIDYSYFDQTPESGINYYRLLQIDFDGQSSYSNVITAYSKLVEVNSIPYFIYPNPSLSRNVFVRCVDDQIELLKQIRVFDGYGKLVLNVSIHQTDNLCAGSGLRLNFAEETKGGTYLIVFLGDSVIYSQKLVLF